MKRCGTPAGNTTRVPGPATCRPGHLSFSGRASCGFRQGESRIPSGLLLRIQCAPPAGHRVPEQSAGDPGEIDQRGVADGAHHLLRDKEDAAADDGADDDGGGLRETEHALERLVFTLRGGGYVCGYGGGSRGESVSLE